MKTVASIRAVTNAKRSYSVPEMSDVNTETQASNTFNAEAFAMNIAKAMETSGQALAAYLKPREGAEPKDKPPSEVAEVIKTFSKVAEYWLSDNARAAANAHDRLVAAMENQNLKQLGWQPPEVAIVDVSPSAISIAPSISHMPMPVPTAQPTAPSFGSPRLPNTSSQFTTTLNSRPNSAMTITGLVWLMLAV